MSAWRLVAAALLLATPACGTADAVRAHAGPPASTTTTMPPRSVTEEAWTPFATAGGVTLTHPSSRVEHVGFHQSNNDGARQLTALPTAVAPVTLDDRERDTGGRGAADVVVDPATEIRAPVTGRVKRAGRYVLYCKYTDDYVVIEPDSHPGWEVKILHIAGVAVRAGNRVVAGQTVLAPGPAHLPFESQVDEIRTAEPAWPHVHIEVVDPTIPDRPGPPCT
jgi:murein DD-endopeptidase MepM/ murein hydrolase activator NlpD